MKGQSFIDFLKEQEGKADRQKVLALSALIGSSVLAQLMFAGVTQSHPGHCGFTIDCADPVEKDQCRLEDCLISCPGPDPNKGQGTCYHP